MGHVFYFCGPKCKARFAADALRYAGAPSVTPSAAPVVTPVVAPAVPAAQAEAEAPASAGRWHRGWLLVPALLLVLAVAGLWLA